MGVRHLYTFITETVPNGVVQINMNDEVDKFKKENNGRTPIIIVDLFAFHKRIFTNNHEILIGGRYNLYNERMNSILTKLHSLDAKIIYFCDGSQQADKFETHSISRNDNYNSNVKLLNAIDDGLDLNTILNNYRVQNLTAVKRNVVTITKGMGELHTSVLNECDQEIAKLANSLKALAIISQDTDFLIFEGKWRYWSSSDIDFETLRTTEFNKAALRDALSLSKRRMALFGTLAGNDILDYEIVKHYHNQIAPKGGKFYKIADDVRKIRSLPPTLYPAEEKLIVNKVFRTQDRDEGLKKLRKSMNLYCYENMCNEFQDPILETVSKDSAHFNLIILCGHNSTLSYSCIDLSKNIFMPYHELVNQILRRIMGVLLKYKQNLRPVRKFYYKKDHEGPYELITETPEYPSYQLPPLLKLLYHPYGDDEQLDELRLNLFCWIISPKLTYDIIKQLPKDNLITSIAILYLIEKNQISIEEADCILLASNCTTEIRDSLSLDECTYIEGRDARLAFLYPNIFNYVDNAVNAVGLRIFNSLLTFDGLYFHNLRKKCRENRDSLNDLIKDFQHLRIYVQ